LVTTYASLLTGHAQRLDSEATARTRRAVRSDERGPFAYLDTASSRAGVAHLSERLAGGSVGILGLGGTGSHVLDLVAKTPVEAIHLYDHDFFLQHNAFRAPGAASVDDLTARRSKVDHFAQIYSRLHRGVFPHRVRLDTSNLHLLDRSDFLFICVDDAATRRLAAVYLESGGRSFIDVGLGLQLSGTGVFGLARVTLSTPGARRPEHRCAQKALDVADPYRTNVQVADLNALNAALAVIRWKRLRGFYAGGRGEGLSVYSIESNDIVNEDRRP
ncbi:MAG: ThiF family adenylyltransferase, partial [Sphingomonadales bacterium]